VYVYISVMTTLSDCHGNEYDNIDMFGLGGFDLLYAAAGQATANTYKKHSCEPVSVYELPVVDLYWSENTLHCYCEC